MELKFREVRADEIDCRVSTVSEKGCSLLLYKDARCDQNILDETVGAMNWQRKHTRENANCTVEIWDVDKNMWVSKEDTGTESFTEKEKGLASDSFKRACFNWGIGRELYTAPFIWISSDNVKLENKNGKQTTYDKFSVKSMKVENGKIVALQITNTRTNKVVFTMGSKTTEPQSEAEADARLIEDINKSKIDVKKVTALKNKAKEDGVSEKFICEKNSIESLDDLSMEQFMGILKNWSKEYVSHNGK